MRPSHWPRAGFKVDGVSEAMTSGWPHPEISLSHPCVLGQSRGIGETASWARDGCPLDPDPRSLWNPSRACPLDLPRRHCANYIPAPLITNKFRAIFFLLIVFRVT